ncbi:MAG: hypothetical protein M0Z67_05200 [Nitrospiraceae bacterium]|nr:hypothetical protein [Nitrospiraceae bacterium]
MKSSAKHIAVFFIFSFVLLPSLTFAGVKIELKNGRTITADSCEDAGGVFMCSRMGGTFDIEKKDIVKISEITGGSEDYDAVPDGTDTLQQADQEKKDGGKKDDGDQMKEVPAGGGAPNADSRAADRRRRRAELSAEYEALMKEREQLQEDLKKAPDWLPVNRYQDLQRRNAELNVKIRKYTEEVDRLNREEKNIDENKEKKD